jgi:hypothetical protein
MFLQNEGIPCTRLNPFTPQKTAVFVIRVVRTETSLVPAGPETKFSFSEFLLKGSISN